CEPAERISYQKAFQRHLNIDPLEADHATLANAANQLNILVRHEIPMVLMPEWCAIIASGTELSTLQ
ncbi:hypothetical protein GASC598B02_001790, partial [Gilliamella apicola SCGC AB-598-B02]